MIGDIHTGSAFLLGLLGTGHCLGMCGPLVAVLPGAYGHWRAHAAYHAGRITTYTLTGAALGALGAGLTHIGALGGSGALQWTARLQVGISALAALLLLILGIVRLGLVAEPRWMALVAPHKIPGYTPAMQKIKNRHSFLWLFALGLMLGLLPCGLSYAAFARALATHNTLDGAGLTLVFGMGTLPGLLILGTGLGAIWRRYRIQMEIAAGLLMVGMAASLVMDIWTAYF